MGSDDDEYTPWAPHPKTIVRIGWTTAALSLLVAIVSAIGEILGWWGLLGEVGMTIGTVVSILIAIATGTYASSKHQAEKLLALNRSHSDKLDTVDERLVSMDGNLESMDGNLESMDGSLVSVDSKLDAVELELDKQTGVLDRQLDVLERIQERL